MCSSRSGRSFRDCGYCVSPLAAGLRLARGFNVISESNDQVALGKLLFLVCRLSGRICWWLLRFYLGFLGFPPLTHPQGVCRCAYTHVHAVLAWSGGFRCLREKYQRMAFVGDLVMAVYSGCGGLCVAARMSFTWEGKHSTVTALGYFGGTLCFRPQGPGLSQIRTEIASDE